MIPSNSITHGIYLSALLFSLVLTGCATHRAPTASNPTIAWHEHQDQMATIHEWLIQGRMAIKHEDNGWNFTVNWKQEDARYNIHAIAPLGQGSAHITGDRNNATLETSEGYIRHAHDAQTLLYQELGWMLPVEALYFWLRGIPAPYADANETINEHGFLAKLEQLDWQVEYERYSLVDHYWLPTHLTLYHHTMRIRLIIKNWTINQPELQS